MTKGMGGGRGGDVQGGGWGGGGSLNTFAWSLLRIIFVQKPLYRYQLNSYGVRLFSDRQTVIQTDRQTDRFTRTHTYTHTSARTHTDTRARIHGQLRYFLTPTIPIHSVNGNN